MSTVKEITTAIRRLPRKEFFRLHKWVRRRFEGEWDKEIAEDARTGRLDKLAAEALAEHRAGRTIPLSIVLKR